MIKKLANLSKLNVSPKEEVYLKKQFDETLKIIDQFEKLDTSNTLGTYTVVETENIFRDDEINTVNMLTQEEALSNSKLTHNGFFVVDGIIQK